MNDVIAGPDGKSRCQWSGSAPEFFDYHDNEWGFPEGGDHNLFEKLCLESFQSGLSWRTILSKRDNFRAAFHNFDFDVIAGFNDADISRLLGDAGIVRHRGKIEAAINNASRAQEMVKSEGSLATYFWCYEAPVDDSNDEQNRVNSEVAIALSKDLKARGWSFVGPTTVYAFMQASGLFNDHSTGCFVRGGAERARQNFVSPSIK